MVNAVYAGHVHLLKWASKKGICVTSWEAVMNAERFGQLKVYKWLESQGSAKKGNPGSISRVVSSGNVEFLKYVLGDEKLSDCQRLLNLAFQRSRFEMLKFLYSRPEVVTSVVPNFVYADFSNPELLRFISDLYPAIDPEAFTKGRKSLPLIKWYIEEKGKTPTKSLLRENADIRCVRYLFEKGLKITPEELEDFLYVTQYLEFLKWGFSEMGARGTRLSYKNITHCSVREANFPLLFWLHRNGKTEFEEEDFEYVKLNIFPDPRLKKLVLEAEDFLKKNKT